MNKKIIILTIIVSVFILMFFAGCELFDGAPERDNINDPETTLEYSVSLSFTNTYNSIGVNWTQDNVSTQTKHEIYYGTDDDINNADKTDYIENAMEYVLENVNYGETYNIWLRAVDAETDETVFIKHGTSMPEPSGNLDPDFATDGKYSLPFLQSQAYDIVGTSSNGMYIGAGSDVDAMEKQIIFKLTTGGVLDPNFAVSGLYDQPIMPISVNMALLNSDIIAFKETAAVELLYYKNNAGTSSTLFNYYARASEGTEDNHMIITGQNGLSKFSVIRFDSLLVITNSDEYSLDHSDGYTIGVATSIDLRNGLVYAAGYREDAAYNRIMHAVVLEQSTLGISNTLSLNADWDPSENRVRSIGTTGSIAEPRIAASPDGSVYVTGVGILSKFHENGNVIDIDGSFASDGSYTFSNNMYPADLLVQENGKIILVVIEVDSISSPTPIVQRSIVYRITADGLLDTTFGSNGSMILENIELSGADMTQEGKIILAGKDLTSSKAVVYQLK